MWKSVHSLLTDEEAETEAHRRRMMERKRERERFIESSGTSEKFSGGLVDNVLSLSFSLSFLMSLSVSQLPEISQ